MKLSSLIAPANLLPHLTSRTKAEAIREMLDRLSHVDGLLGGALRGPDADSIYRELMDREAKGSTGLGQGLGYPHARLQGFSGFLLALGTSREGVEYDAPDGQPVFFIVMAVVPAEKSNLLLGVVACLSRLTADRALMDQLTACDSSAALWGLIDASGLEVKESVTAGDLCVRRFVSASPETTLADAASLMHTQHVDALPVLDAEGRLLGEITARDLFLACLPSYFAQLPSLRFVRDFDAFETFVQQRAHRKLSEALHRKVPTLDPDAPLAEIVARLAKMETGRLYVVEKGRLIGVLDNFTIIDKVLCL